MFAKFKKSHFCSNIKEPKGGIFLTWTEMDIKNSIEWSYQNFKILFKITYYPKWNEFLVH